MINKKMGGKLCVGWHGECCGGRSQWPFFRRGGGGGGEQHPHLNVQIFLPRCWQMSFSNINSVINLQEKLEYAD